MENANPFVHVPPNGLHVRITQELNELRAISAMIDSYLGQPLNNFINSHDVIEMDDLESDDGSVDTPLVSPFLDSDDGEVLNELDEKFVAYFDPFLPMNIITPKAYNTIIVEGLESTGRNLVAVVRDVYVFIGSFTYVTDFVVLEDIGEFIVSNLADVVMGRPFRAVTQLEYDCIKGLISFSRIFDTYIFRMPRTMPRLKNFNWSKIRPILVLSQRDLMSGLSYYCLLRVNAAGTKLQLLKDKDCLKIKITYEIRIVIYRIDHNPFKWDQQASSIICPDLDALIPYTINGDVYCLTAEKLQAHMDKEKQIKKAKSTGAILASNPPALAKQDKSNVGLVFEATTGSPIWSLVLEPHRRLDVFGAWLHRNGVAWKRYPSPKYRSSITIHDLVDQTHLVLEELERELGKVELEKSGVD
ncbi:hypothetical protein Tco_1066700 [Tanacetum coccineum]|uniref:Uncharacterized protein n=1 Tax=Tanacetum coccineum TaxID=301880 RepID=A0ABQ5HCW8_9ASTR